MNKKNSHPAAEATVRALPFEITLDKFGKVYLSTLPTGEQAEQCLLVPIEDFPGFARAVAAMSDLLAFTEVSAL